MAKLQTLMVLIHHGNKDNLTGKSRLSIDFRIFPLKFYNQQEQEQTQTLTQKEVRYWRILVRIITIRFQR